MDLNRGILQVLSAHGENHEYEPREGKIKAEIHYA